MSYLFFLSSSCLSIRLGQVAQAGLALAILRQQRPCVALLQCRMAVIKNQPGSIKAEAAGENITSVMLWSAQPSGDILMHSYFGP